MTTYHRTRHTSPLPLPSPLAPLIRVSFTLMGSLQAVLFYHNDAAIAYLARIPESPPKFYLKKRKNRKKVKIYGTGTHFCATD